MNIALDLYKAKVRALYRTERASGYNALMAYKRAKHMSTFSYINKRLSYA